MPSFSAFDSRGYRTVAPREGYERWAATCEDTVENAMDLALLERVSVDWSGIGTVADLGCGTGRTGAWLKAHGVGEIDGIDLSPAMLEAARRRTVHRSPRKAEVGDGARGVYRSLREGDVGDTG